MVNYLYGRSARHQLDLGTEPRVPLKSIWESMDGPFEDDLGLDLGSIRGMFGDTLWYVRVHFEGFSNRFAHSARPIVA